MSRISNATPTVPTAASRRAIATNRLVEAGVIGAILVAAANLLVYFLVPALFSFSLNIPLMGPGSEIQPLPLAMVAVMSVVPAVCATILLWGLSRFTARPLVVFRTFAAVVLLLSFGAPLSLGVPLNVLLTLMSMHVIAAVTITYALTTRVGAVGQKS